MRRPESRAKSAPPAYLPGMDAAPDARIHLDTVITPERSLSLTGFKLLLGVLILANLIVGTFLLTLGAWPAPIFLGLDVLGVFIAFRISYRRAAMRERVVVTSDSVQVLKELDGKTRAVWSSPTAFTRVRLERSDRYGAQLRLTLSRKHLLIGQALGPKEREGLAFALEEAIRQARSERHPSPPQEPGGRPM